MALQKKLRLGYFTSLKSKKKKKITYFCSIRKLTHMSEIKISIDDQYLKTFMAFLQTLNYVRVEEVAKEGTKVQKAKAKSDNATEVFLSQLPPESPLRQAIKPIRKGSVTEEDLIRESGYVRTDWEKIREIGLAMDIPQSTEELLAQLTA